MLLSMESLPGEAQAASRLKATSLRDFDFVQSSKEGDDHLRLPSHKFTVTEAPVPSLYKYALTLIGCPASGPAEKVLWWVDFTYKGEWCELALQKFGLRIYLRTDRPEDEALATQITMAEQLHSSMKTVERVVQAAAPELLSKGNATVRHQHRSLLRAYQCS